MVQLNSFCAVHYRDIDGLTLSNLTKANLITGTNGVGKTALIEAMWLFVGRYNPSLLWNINLQRTLNPITNPLSRLTKKNDLVLSGVEKGDSHNVNFQFEKIHGSLSNFRTTVSVSEDVKILPPVVGYIKTYIDEQRLSTESQSMHATPTGIVLHETPTMPTDRPASLIDSTRLQYETPEEYLQRYSHLVREGYKGELVRALGLVAPGVVDVEILTDEGGESYLSVMLSDGRIRPLHDLGGGAIRLARLLIGFSASQGAVMLTDELENGIHYSVQRGVWRAARQWMHQWDVQLIATSHSAEFIDAAIDTFSDNLDDLSIHKIYRNRNTGRPEAATFSGEALVGARELDLEIR